MLFEAISLVFGMVISITISVLAFCKIGKASDIDSVSNISYVLGQYVFTIWIAILGFTLLPAILTCLNANFQWMGFLSVVGLFCVASTPLYQTENKILHWIGGILWFVLSLIIVTMLNPYLLCAWIIYAALMCIRTLRSSFVFYGEMFCYLLLSTGLLLTMF